ncbi:uncharacterized protein BO88DRAFT_486396 [Aspergillus vadensis CBS 113365]|uniref:Yeast cell wall synthesis Kre9/Knh1-like N-terminal domain-containing protein n=1 Tax=Aspergillus vadensis (strain CBS 113365 / IMI 142717 / IBT 24658) TaxID=1448311 RepID=A0A319CRX2_ASPVC|nr:hypothetical protein BO88DRAFT_486396 [Aspergillus vadensis CBS 113365]PYH71042.1 hypothetical protein BO88DRAFT_486396 [Aspergillus vadensis CBS 113365]
MHTLKSLLLTAFTLSSTLTTTAATTTSSSTPTYSITEPTSGAIISLNTATVISWNTTAPSTSKLSIHLSKTTNETSNLYTIATNISNSGSISWSPPSRVGTGSDYIVVLEPSSSSETYTSPPFTISSSTNASTTYYPTEGEIVKTGQTTIITWEVERNVSEVSIYLMEGELNNGNGTADGSGLKNVTTITTDIANSGDVACVLPGSVQSGDDYRFAIVDVKDVGRVKYSAVFEVVNSGDDSSSEGSSSSSTSSGDGSESSSSGDGSGSATGNGKETSGAAKLWCWGGGWGVVGLVVGSLLVYGRI